MRNRLLNFLLLFLLCFGLIFLAWILENSEFVLTSRSVCNPLNGNEHLVEQLIGDYSDFYVKVDLDYNQVVHAICGTESNGVITILVPETYDESNITLDFYTSWDAYLCSYLCNFTQTPEYHIKDKTIVCVKSKLPFIFADVDSESFKRVNSSYTPENPVKEKAVFTFMLYDPETGELQRNVSAEIRPRGASSWNIYHKRPYSIKFAAPRNLLGIGSYRKWNIIANAADKTLIRNKCFYQMAENMGLPYTPKCELVNFYVNSNYTGVYGLTTKVDCFCDSALTRNDFLISFGSPNGNLVEYSCSFDTEYNGKTGKPMFEFVWPDKHITPAYTDRAQVVIQNYVNTIESYGDLESVIDLDSFARYYWVQEITMNVDAWYHSNYVYYKNSEDKLYAGPVWDLDVTLGAVGLDKENCTFTTPDGWKIRNYGYYVPLFKNKQFVERVTAVYYELDVPAIMEQAYSDFQEMEQSFVLEGELNYQIDQEENWHDFEYYYDTDYLGYTDEKLKFFRQRIDWIEQEMGN